jgi:hypothetical protein
MADNISNIIDYSEFSEQLSNTIAGLQTLIAKINQVNENHVTIAIDAEGMQTLTDIVNMTKKQADAQGQANVVLKEGAQVTQQLNDIQDKFGAGLVENAKTLVELKQELTYVDSQIKQFTKDINSGKDATADASAKLADFTRRQIELKQAISATTAEMKKQTDIGLAAQQAAANKKAEAEERAGQRMILAAQKTEIAQVNAATKAATAQQAAAEKAALANERAANKSILSWENFTQVFQRQIVRITASLIIYSAIIAAFTALYDWWTKLSNAEEIAKDNLEAYAAGVKQLSEDLDNLPFKELAKKQKDAFALQRLVDYIKGVQDVKGHIEGLYAAYQKIQTLAPGIVDVFKNKNEFAKAIGSDRMNKQLDAAGGYVSAKDEIDSKTEILNKTIEVQKNTIQQLQENKKEKDDLDSHKPDIESAGGNVFTLAKDEAVYALKVKANKENYETLEKNFKEYSRSIIEQQSDLAKKEAAFYDKYGRTKDPTVKKPNAKDLNAELKQEDERYAAELALAQKSYDNKERLNKKAGNNEEVTFTHQQELLKAQQQANTDHFQIREHIMEAFYGKTGETAAQWKARMMKDVADELEENNKLAESADKNSEAYKKALAEKKKALEDWARYVEETARKFQAIEDETANIKAQGKVRHDYAQGAGGFLEGMGVENSDYAEKQQQLQIQKEAKLKEHADAQNAANILLAKPEKTKEDQKQIDDLQLQANTAGKDATKLADDQQAAHDEMVLEGKRKIGALTVQLAQQTFDAIKTIRDNQFAAEQQQLQIQAQELQIRSTQQIAAINATAGFQITKSNEVAAVTAQTAAAQNAIQEKQNNLELKKAIADKKFAEAQVIMNTATAIMKTWAGYADQGEVGAALAAAQTALLVGIGAAQYAAAASTPLPQFWQGGDTYTPFFRAGEKGAELGTTPTGQKMLFAKDAVYSAPIGTHIETAQETEKIFRYAINNIGNNAMPKWDAPTMTDKNIVQCLQDNNELLTGLLMKNTSPKIIINVPKNRRFPGR